MKLRVENEFGPRRQKNGRTPIAPQSSFGPHQRANVSAAQSESGSIIETQWSPRIQWSSAMKNLIAIFFLTAVSASATASSYLAWDYGVCREYTPAHYPIGDDPLPIDTCKNRIGFYTAWHYGECKEYTPAHHYIQSVPIDNCRTLIGSYADWHYGECKEYTPAHKFVQLLPKDTCRTRQGIIVKKDPPPVPRQPIPSVILQNLKGEPYAWAPSVTGPQKSQPGKNLADNLQNASTKLMSVYEAALASLSVVRPVTEEGEDRNKVILLENTLKVAVSTLQNQGTTLPVTHWRVRENARMILVMSEIAVSVFGEIADIKETKDSDSRQRNAIQNFAQAMTRVQFIISGIRETFGLKGFVGEASKASNPLAKIFQLQLLQLKATLGGHKDAGDAGPRFEKAFAALEEQIARIKDLNGKGDSSNLLKIEVKKLANIWNSTGSGSTQELVQRAFLAGSTIAADAQMLYLAAASLGNIHKQITFTLPSVTPGTTKK